MKVFRFLTVVVVSSHAQEQCFDKSSNCDTLKVKCENPIIYSQLCRKTCNACEIPTTTTPGWTVSVREETVVQPPKCEDKEKSAGFCSFWKSQCSTAIVGELCKVTCGLCSINVCADKAPSTFCESWSSQCELSIVSELCPLTCSVCSEVTTTTTGTTSATTTTTTTTSTTTTSSTTKKETPSSTSPLVRNPLSNYVNIKDENGSISEVLDMNETRALPVDAVSFDLDIEAIQLEQSLLARNFTIEYFEDGVLESTGFDEEIIADRGFESEEASEEETADFSFWGALAEIATPNDPSGDGSGDYFVE